MKNDNIATIMRFNSIEKKKKKNLIAQLEVQFFFKYLFIKAMWCVRVCWGGGNSLN